MEATQYGPVQTTPEAEDTRNASNISRKYLLRQILVCSGIWASYFCFGLSFGSPTVIIPQIRREANSSDAVSIQMESWLSSTFNYSGLISAVILAILARKIGRKLSFLFICITSLIGYILFYCSSNLTEILISEILQGPLASGPVTISIMVLTEYTSPGYRGVFLTLKSAIFLWGIWVANAIGTFFHWKNIGIVAIICSIYSLLTTLLWPESPYWLANQNRFEDCATSHHWLKGRSKESEAELEKVIESRKNVGSVTTKPIGKLKTIASMFRSKSFYKPISLSFLVLSLYHFSGKLACGMYAIDIIKRITGTELMAYRGMLILDGISILGMYVGCGLSKFFKRRTLLLVSSSIAVLFLFCLSLYLFLIYLKIILENTIISMALLMGYSLTISVGPMIMATTILGELIPMKYRSSSVLLVGCFGNFVMGSIVKISPFILKYFGARGLFLFFAVIETCFIVITYNVLPETKDKTILEIQQCLLDTKLNRKKKRILM